MEDRPLLEDEAAGLGAVDLRTGDVGGQQVGSELDAVELGLHAASQLLDRARLGQAGRTFDQHVAVGQQGDQQAFDQAILAQDLGGKHLAQGDYGFTVFHRIESSREKRRGVSAACDGRQAPRRCEERHVRTELAGRSKTTCAGNACRPRLRFR